MLNIYGVTTLSKVGTGLWKLVRKSAFRSAIAIIRRHRAFPDDGCSETFQQIPRSVPSESDRLIHQALDTPSTWLGAECAARRAT
jgi:hypothetical protein